MFNAMSISGLSVVWLHIHWFFAVTALVGFVLITVWAMKHLSGEKLKITAISVLAAGIVGALLTAPLAVSGLRTVHASKSGMECKMMGSVGNSMMTQMMQRMMDHDAGITGPTHDEHQEMEGMMRMMMGGDDAMAEDSMMDR
jgi:hypothetical protein